MSGIRTIANIDQPVKTASGVKERPKVLELTLAIRSRGILIILISHNMPHVFGVSDRIHVHRRGKPLCRINPKAHSISDAVVLMARATLPVLE